MIDTEILQHVTPDSSGLKIIACMVGGLILAVVALALIKDSLGNRTKTSGTIPLSRVTSFLISTSGLGLAVTLFIVGLSPVVDDWAHEDEADQEVQRVNRMIPTAVKNDYRVTDVTSDLSAEEILDATSSSLEDSPTITIVTKDGRKAEVDIEINAKTEAVKLFSTDTALKPADLRR